MKQFLTIFFIAVAISLSAQKPKAGAKPKSGETRITLTKSTLINARTIRDLIGGPKGCKVGGYLLTIKSGSNFKEIKGKGETLPAEAVAAFKHLNANQGFTVENIKGGCKGMKKKYEVLIK